MSPGLPPRLQSYAGSVVAQEVPSLFVRRPAAGWVGGIEHDGNPLTIEYESCRNDVPDAFGNHVRGEEIEIPSLVGPAGGGANVAFVEVPGPEAGRGLDLDAHKMAVGLDHRVVTGRVAHRLGNPEVAFGGSCDKLQFRPLATTLAILDSDLHYLDLGFHRGNKKRGLERPRPFL